jgi:hypothetical protein
MSVSASRYFLGWVMLAVFPPSLLAADPASAIVHSKGGVWVNGNEVADSTTVFPGDALETRSGFVANLDMEGSSVLVGAESVVKFERNFLTLEHGSVNVGTSTSFSVHVNCIKVEPVLGDRTQYDVTDVNGSVQVAAHKNDVRITQGGHRKASAEKSSASEVVQEPSSQKSSASDIVHEGQQGTRDETSACGAGRPEVAGHLLNTKWLEIGAGAAGVGGSTALCVLLCKAPEPSNISPVQPGSSSDR